MDGFGSKWTVQGLNCTVQTSKSGRSWSKKVDGPKGEKLDGLKEENWTVIGDESRRSKRLEVDGSKGSKWTV